jgi:hypothetical protein
MPTTREVQIAAEQLQIINSARRITQALNNELAKLGPAARRSLLCGIHEGLTQKIAEGDKATRLDQEHKMQTLAKGKA